MGQSSGLRENLDIFICLINRNDFEERVSREE
jgi:hypothetical protein